MEFYSQKYNQKVGWKKTVYTNNMQQKKDKQITDILKEIKQDFSKNVIRKINTKPWRVWPHMEEVISKSLYSIRKTTLEEAIEIFKKYKDESMTGNVVLIELMALKDGKPK